MYERECNEKSLYEFPYVFFLFDTDVKERFALLKNNSMRGLSFCSFVFIIILHVYKNKEVLQVKYLYVCIDLPFKLISI